MSREATLTTGPSTSPRRASAGPQARPTRSSGKSSSRCRSSTSSRPIRAICSGVVGHEQDLVADGLDDAAVVRGDDLQRARLEVVDQVAELLPAQRPALPRVVDDVGEAHAHDDARRRPGSCSPLGSGSSRSAASRSRAADGQRVPAPDVALQRLDRRDDLVHHLAQLVELHLVEVDHPWRAGPSATRPAGRSCGPGCGSAPPRRRRRRSRGR